MKRIEIFGLQTIPEIKQGDNLSQIITTSAANEIGGLHDKDIIILTSKIVSKAAGLTIKYSEVKPGPRAVKISKKTGKDAKWLQMIFDQGHKILAIVPLKGIAETMIMNSSQDSRCAKELVEHEQALCVTLGKDSRIHTCDAGIDGSNHQPGIMSFLPTDPDKSAREIRHEIQRLCGKEVAVILADTEMVPFGTMDLALGSSGIEPRTKMFGKLDNFRKPKFGGMDLTAHELTAASALLFGQTNAAIPVAVVRGYEYQPSETENISNTLLPKGNSSDFTCTIKAAMRATAYAKGFWQRTLLRIASWFI